MAYVSPNLKSKAEIKRAIASGAKITVFNPGLGGPIPQNGTAFVEGPHSPKPHTWYGQAILKDGYVVAIK